MSLTVVFAHSEEQTVEDEDSESSEREGEEEEEEEGAENREEHTSTSDHCPVGSNRIFSGFTSQ